MQSSCNNLLTSKLTIRSNIIRCPIGKSFEDISLKKQDEWVSKIVEYYQYKGFNYILPKKEEQEKDFERMVNFDVNKLLHEDCIGFNHMGNTFLISYFNHFWNARTKTGKSVKEIFENKKYLNEIVREIILNNKFPSKHLIKTKCKRYRNNKSVSGFMPIVAKAIYEKYANSNSKVIDFCSGYGGRYLGSMICNKISSYTGIDINFDSYSSLMDLNNDMNKKGFHKTVNIINGDSVEAMESYKDKYFDLCFTSPPYYDSEEYDQEENQSFKKYEQYNEWFNYFLMNSVNEAIRISKKAIINISNTGAYKIANDLEKHLNKEKINFTFDRLRMPKYGGKVKYEPLFIIDCNR
jgi:hypothetical protein